MPRHLNSVEPVDRRILCYKWRHNSLTSIVGRGEGVELLLARCVPNHELHALAAARVQLDRLFQKVDACSCNSCGVQYEN